MSRCKHEEVSEINFCDDCGKWVYYVYCPKCLDKSIDVAYASCRKCGTRLEPDDVLGI